MAQQARGLDQHVVLERCRRPVVERLDVRPEFAHARDFARDRVGACDAADVGARIFLHSDREDRAHAVHQAVRDGRYDDLAPQLVLLDLAREPALHRLREVARQFSAEERVFRDVGFPEPARQPDLRIGQQHRELGAREALALAAPFGDFVGGRQRFQGAVQRAAALEGVDDVAELGDALGRARLGVEIARLCR